MDNSNEAYESLRLIASSYNSFTGDALNRIMNICGDLIQDELPGYVKKNLGEIDGECCRLMRNRLLLKGISDRIISEKDDDGSTCSFPDVYSNCCRTVDAICSHAGVEFSFSSFLPDCVLGISAKECCYLLMLPIALALERDKNAKLRLIASKKHRRLELEYASSVEMPQIADLVEECRKTDYSSGLFFAEPLLGLNLHNAAEDCGALLYEQNKKLTLSIPILNPDTTVTSPSESYIDNRFSLPYIMLSDVIRREI